MVAETGECVASDGRLGTRAGWHCVVHGMPSCLCIPWERRHRWEKIPKEPLLGWLELWTVVEIRDTKLLTISEVSV